MSRDLFVKRKEGSRAPVGGAILVIDKHHFRDPVQPSREKDLIQKDIPFFGFSVGYFRSFKQTETLSLVAANLSAQDKTLDENNVFSIGNNHSLLKSAAIYGANASGKSNLVRAFEFMRALNDAGIAAPTYSTTAICALTIYSSRIIRIAALIGSV